MTVLRRKLAEAKAEGRAALVGYYPAGFPDVASSIRVVQAMVAGGCDVIEVGFPYSDPTMDGPVIQQAADRALAAGTTPKDVLAVVRAVADAGAAALVMSYWNPIEKYGVDAFAADLAAPEVGVTRPDPRKPIWIRPATPRGSTGSSCRRPPPPAPKACAASRGFVCAASLMG